MPHFFLSMDFYFVARAKRAFQTCCSLCLKFIGTGTLYVRAVSGETAHFRCAGKHNWRRRTSKKPKPVKIEHGPEDKSIKVVRAGKTIKVVKRER